MSDLVLKLAFSDPETSAAFARKLERVDLGDEEFRLARLDPKLNADTNADTLALVMKITGGAAMALSRFLGLTTRILDVVGTPAVKIEVDGRTVELNAKASPEAIKPLCDVLLGAGR